MSGHSHYATIHRQKEIKDAQKGKIFSKHARAISIAVKEGGGENPDLNYKLRIAIDAAKSDNMPKTNIERAIVAGKKGEAVEEITYEGFGPSGIAVMVVAATDNRNRTSQEIKNIFERVGGRFAGAGSVAYNFEPKGFILVKKEPDPESQMLKLIDAGVEEMEEVEDGIEVYTPPAKLFETKEALEDNGFVILVTQLMQKPKNLTSVADPEKAKKVLGFLEDLEDHDDVQRVFANVDIPANLTNI